MVVFEFIIDFLWTILCYHVGFMFLRAITFGKYPPSSEKGQQDTFVEIVGLCVFAVLLIVGWFWLTRISN